jgi:hypothetical protein
MPPQASDFEREMQILEAEIKRLEAEYNMFFAGRLPRLPWETRARVTALVKRYDRQPMTNTAQRFRFGTLQARFVSFCDLWEKHLKAREEGRPMPGRGRHAAPLAPPASEPGSAAARSHAVKERSDLLHEAKLTDPLREAERLQDLYQRLSEAREKTGEAQIPFHRFAEVVRAQMAKHGGDGREVSFQVAMKDGKVTLSAKGKGD